MIATAAVLVAVISGVRRESAGRERVAPLVNDTLPWTPDDVALLGTTGRPQLVEFYHPT